MSKLVNSGGIGCFPVVGVVFMVLKLHEIQPVVSWSWVWVLCPFWIGLALDIVLVLLALILVWLSSRE